MGSGNIAEDAAKRLRRMGVAEGWTPFKDVRSGVAQAINRMQTAKENIDKAIDALKKLESTKADHHGQEAQSRMNMVSASMGDGFAEVDEIRDLIYRDVTSKWD